MKAATRKTGKTKKDRVRVETRESRGKVVMSIGFTFPRNKKLTH